METLVCRHCGFEGSSECPVELPREYVGGHGYTKTGPFCRDLVACWDRWDAGARGAAWDKVGTTEKE